MAKYPLNYQSVSNTRYDWFFSLPKEKKEQEERERQKRLIAGEKESENHARNIEATQFNKILKEHNLKIFEVCHCFRSPQVFLIYWCLLNN